MFTDNEAKALRRMCFNEDRRLKMIYESVSGMRDEDMKAKRFAKICRELIE